MDKRFYFEYADGMDGDYESPDYPTREEAENAKNELEEQGYRVGEIKEIRV